MKTIPLDFKPSVLLSAFITAVSAGAAGILILLEFSWQIKLLSLLLVIGSAIYSVSCHGLLLLPWSCVGLSINSKHELQLQRKDGVQLPVTPLASSVVTPYLTVLNCRLADDNPLQGESLVKRCWFKLHTIHYAVIILPDKLERESFRQLRVWLRWGVKTN